MGHHGIVVVGYERTLIPEHVTVDFSPSKDYEQVFDFESLPE
jgi:hypothetical protein